MPFDFRSLSLFKIIALALAVLCIVMLFLPWVRVSVSLVDASESGNAFKTGFADAKSFWSFMLGVFAVLAILAVILAAFGILTDRTTLALPLSCLAVLMFLFAFFQVLHIKSEMKGAMAGYSAYFKDLVKVRIGIGGWLFLLFGLGSFGVLAYESHSQGRGIVDFSQFSQLGEMLPVKNIKLPSFGKKDAGERPAPRAKARPAARGKVVAEARPGAWTCPNCGANMSARRDRCTLCGEEKPE